MDNCLICKRIKQIKTNSNPYFVKELSTGYVVMGDHQFYTGYTVFLSKTHLSELHNLKKNIRSTFLSEMAMVAEAVFKAFKPDKLNYELLGNTDQHMHWHIFPRRKTDPKPYTAVWAVDKEIRSGDSAIPNAIELNDLKQKILKEINQLVIRSNK